MLSKILFIALMAFAIDTRSQANLVNLASIAWEKGHFQNAYENADAALRSEGTLQNSEVLKAFALRGKAATRLAYSTLTKGEDSDTEKYAGMALRAYLDFKEVMTSRDSALIKDVTPEFYKLGHALLLSGTDYDALNADKEMIDSSIIDRSIECYTATITLWEWAGREKYKPFYYRGDALLEKKEYEKAIIDLQRAMELFVQSSHKLPDLGIGDLGYRLAYTQAGVFKDNEAAKKTIEQTRQLLNKEMELAESKKERIADQMDDLKAQFDYLMGELNSLMTTVSK